MKNYKVQISKKCLSDLFEVTLFVALHTSVEHSKVYKDKLRNEIESLSYLADIIKFSDFEIAKQYNKKAKVLITKNRKWSVMFHTFRNHVIVDKIIPSKMMIH